MIVLIKDVFAEDVSWITAKLKSDREIEVFDPESCGLEKYKNKEMDILIIASFINRIDCKITSENPVFKGTFIGEYTIPGTYFSSGKDYNGFMGFETDDGIFLISLLVTAKELGFIKSETFCIEVSRFDLLDCTFK